MEHTCRSCLYFCEDHKNFFFGWCDNKNNELSSGMKPSVSLDHGRDCKEYFEIK